MNKLKYIPKDLVMVDGFNTIYRVDSVESQPHVNEFLYTLVPIGIGAVIFDLPIDAIYPIPLTTEILGKNGWRKLKSKRYTWWKARFDGVYYFIKPNKDYPSVWKLCCGNTRRRFEKIRYVHQLQHFLFGLGLNHEMKVYETEM